MSIPVWWPEVLAATARRRVYAAEILAHATPTVERGLLRLTFTDPGHLAAWEASGAEAALDGALAHLGWAMQIEVATPTSAAT
ncbi:MULTISPECIES: hypothetical protein [unclassified Streptomyces]|uniref:hypothetical protein n=1 Tax=unclassified Streptomyces TaxID=2593676 RepID=UPI0033A7A03C